MKLNHSNYVSLVNDLVSTFGNLPSFASETEVRANIEKLLYIHGVGIDHVPAPVDGDRDEFANHQPVIDMCEHVIKAAARAGIEGNEMLTLKANVLNVADRMSAMILSLREENAQLNDELDAIYAEPQWFSHRGDYLVIVAVVCILAAAGYYVGKLRGWW